MGRGMALPPLLTCYNLLMETLISPSGGTRPLRPLDC